MLTLGLKPNREEKQEKLNQDFDTPFCGPTDYTDDLPADYPLTDSGVDADEYYQYGFKIAAGADFRENKAVLAFRRPVKPESI